MIFENYNSKEINYKTFKSFEINEELFNDMVIELKLRNYSEKTISTYLFHNIKFLKYIKKFPTQIQYTDIKKYLEYIILNKKLSPATYNLAKNSLKFYYKEIRNKRFNLKAPTAKIQKKVQFVLSVEEIKKMIGVTTNFKHKLLIKILYSSGLRVGECIKLKFFELDLENKYGIIKSGKGNKDRLFVLTDSVCQDIKKLKENMILNNINSNYLFYNFYDNSKHITIRTAEIIIKKSAKFAKINKRVYCHLLRACFATHLFENNVNINTLQKLLGHSRIDTTQNYIRSSKNIFNNLPNLI